MNKAIRINPQDNVAVAIGGALQRGDSVSGIRLIDDVPQGHKFAIKSIAASQPIIKYGSAIGHATQEIAPGQWVHSHNLSTSLGPNLADDYQPAENPQIPEPEKHTFMGYQRADGRAGVRNELWIIPTVGCVNGQAQAIAQRLKAECPGLADDIRAYTHNYGCSQLGTDHANTRRALAALATHPNCGGAILLGLGCENNQMAGMLNEIDCLAPERARHAYPRVKTLIAQEVEDEVAAGVELGKELLQEMASDHRSPLPASLLRLGLKCGGSDGLSGITANPLVGLLSDQLIAQGGSTVLTEVPEMFGAEHVLLRRASTEAVHADMLQLLNGFRDYFRSHNQPVSENPSPGNKAGGITTLEEKSLGCVQKGGTALVTEILQYAQPASKRGLNMLWAPGNDLVASTALALSGCQLILFTTGRGTPFGTCVPTLKISTNSQLAARKSNWIDFNAGVLADGSSDWNESAAALWQKILAVASGEKTHNETAEAKEIAIFKSGVTL